MRKSNELYRNKLYNILVYFHIERYQTIMRACIGKHRNEGK